MKKAELLKLSPMKASNSLIKAFKEDVANYRTKYGSYYGGRKESTARVNRYYDFIQAAVEGKYLKIGIWDRRELENGTKTPYFTIFIDKDSEEWITYNHTEEKWNTGMIFNLPYPQYEGRYYSNGKWSSETTRKVIASYLGVDGTTHEMIRKYQLTKRKNELTKRHRSELEEIDEFMDSVPEYPKGYNNEWLVKTAFIDEANIIYKPGTKEGLCTRCNQMVQLKEKPYHLNSAKCPRCRVDATLRSWGKQKYITARKNVGILQKTIGGENYCLSVQDIELKWKKEDGYTQPHITDYGQFRFRLSYGFILRESFEWYEYKNTGVIRWCHAKCHGMGWNTYIASARCVLFEKNLKTLLKDTELKYVPVDKLIKSQLGKAIHVDEMLENLRRFPQYEKFIKVGLYQLAIESLSASCGHPDEIIIEAEKLEDMLKLDKIRMRTAMQMNVSIKELNTLQASKMAAVNMTAEQVRDFTIFYQHTSKEDKYFILKRGNLEKSLNYLKKIWEEKNKIGHIYPYIVARDYEDYIEQLSKLRIPLDKHSRFPANFDHIHAELSERIREKEDALKKADTRKKNKALKKLVKKLEVLYKADSEEFEIVWPMSKKDFEKEGQLQHNCVGGYFDKMVSEKTVVFFLRKKKDVNTPFCTVEFKNGVLIQCRTIYNGGAPDEAMKYMDKIAENYKSIVSKKLEAAV